MRRGGVTPLVDYPAGRHTLDLVFGERDRLSG
jgi:hypothetical protein